MHLPMSSSLFKSHSRLSSACHPARPSCTPSCLLGRVQKRRRTILHLRLHAICAWRGGRAHGSHVHSSVDVDHLRAIAQNTSFSQGMHKTQEQKHSQLLPRKPSVSERVGIHPSIHLSIRPSIPAQPSPAHPFTRPPTCPVMYAAAGSSARNLTRPATSSGEP